MVWYRNLLHAFAAGVTRLDKSFSPSDTLHKLRGHKWSVYDLIYVVHAVLACFWLSVMRVPSFPAKLLIPILYILGILIPFTSQFVFPATPVFAWLMAFYSNQFIPTEYRPSISVSLLPTLESVLYGANISDILTRFTNPILDVIAWIPYGVGHYITPLILALFLWLFRQKSALVLWGKVFGYMNLTGVLIQIVFPCAAPWYELIYGLTPATYAIRGSAGGLGRIDDLFGSHGYATAFSNSPIVFGAFPSLHAGWATLEALFTSHFFPHLTPYVWCYAGVLYWSTMYLTHHYLIDVVGGACLATAFFYFFLPDALRGPNALLGPSNFGRRATRSKYEQYGLEEPTTTHHANGGAIKAEDFELDSDDDGDEEDEDRDVHHPQTQYRSPNPQRKSDVERSGAAVGVAGVAGGGGARSGGHKHTASIASLIRAEDRGAGDHEAWHGVGSPIGSSFANSARRTDEL